MTDFYQPNIAADHENPFARDGDGKLVRRGYWLDMGDRSIILVMTQGIGLNLTNDQKKIHLADIGRSELIDQICLVEVLPPEK
ncbi:MAG: hypothetical protein ACKVIK_08990 [Rhodospirillales bacterium]|jgi:hypothetical protein